MTPEELLSHAPPEIREGIEADRRVGYAVAFCEETRYQICPPPPNRVMCGGHFETRASRRLTAHWRNLLDNWHWMSLPVRRAAAAAFQDDCDRVHPRPDPTGSPRRSPDGAKTGCLMVALLLAVIALAAAAIGKGC